MLSFDLLSSHVTPKYPSLHIQTNVLTLTSIQLPPLSQGELVHASHGTEFKQCRSMLFTIVLPIEERRNYDSFNKSHTKFSMDTSLLVLHFFL